MHFPRALHRRGRFAIELQNSAEVEELDFRAILHPCSSRLQLFAYPSSIYIEGLPGYISGFF
jgi:hypothetical protein